MALTAGSRIGPYEIQSALGAGGMGEVYRARDTRLDRMVAIKVLSPCITTDPSFLERFDREARAISQLNHPHICTLHDVGQQDGAPYLVLEYLEGETLAARLAKGPLPIQQAVTIGIQICDALDKAHRQGIVHRDLKPGNVMLVGRSGSDPHAKLLDFGLAKSGNPGLAATGGTPGAALTATSPLTAHGTLLGTLQYMAPEQIEGRAADARSDIFALGAVLHEMVSGQRTFDGKSPASVIAAIMERDPPALSTLQTLTPPALDHIVARCLAKDPDERWQSAGDVMRELRWVASTPATLASTPRSASRFREYFWMVVALASAAALGALAIMRPTASPELTPMQTSLNPPPDVAWNAWWPISISPDGRHVVFVARAAGQEPRLWVRSFDPSDSDARPLEGTERGNLPFWSADSRNIGFFVPGHLKRVPLKGGTVQTVTALGEGVGGTWNRDNAILFADALVGLFRVPAAGGKPVQLTKEPAFWPIFLPDGDRYLYCLRPDDRQSGQGPFELYAASLGSPERHRVTRVGSNVALAPPGYLLFQRQRTLVAQPFDSERMQTRGDPQLIASDVGFTGYGFTGAFSVSATGVLVYRTDPPGDRELAWLDRSGTRLSVLGPRGRYSEPALSPDDKTVAYSREDEPTRTVDIYLVNLARPAPSKFTSGSGRNRAPVWSPEGTRIVFQSNRPTDPGLYVKAVDTGKEQPLLRVDRGGMTPRDWSRNGFILAERRQRSAGIFKVPSSGDAGPTQFLDDDLLGEYTPTFSPPDGRWVAYASDDTGRQEVYVRRFDGSGRPVSISGGTGGSEPRWRADGKELFYLTDTSMMAVDIIRTGETLEAGTPRQLFSVSVVTNPNETRYAVKSDGQRFLVVQPVGGNDPLPLTVVQNWAGRLKR
jgi:serine/threonine protein kinase